jgi:hypothetical protein
VPGQIAAEFEIERGRCLKSGNREGPSRLQKWFCTKDARREVFVATNISSWNLILE